MQRGRGQGVVRLAALLLVALFPAHAQAFRAVGGNERFDRQPLVTWQTESIALEMSTDASPLAASTLEAAAMTSAEKWASAECSAPALSITSGAFAASKPGDGRNSVEWVASGWKARGFDVTAPAQTDVQFERDADGVWHVVEADVYLNADAFSWADSPGNGLVTLEPVLLHELGHVLGLLHPCGDDAPSVPACSDDPTFDVVMNPAYSADRTAPTVDDLAGICALYGQRVASCTSTADCTAGLSCNADGVCAPGTASIGAPCEADADCSSGLCTNQICAQPCSEDKECSPDSTCSVKDGIGVCVSTLRELGASCSQSEECASQQCVLDQQDKGYCTRPCSADNACPQDWMCGATHAENVCVPRTTQLSGGCTFAAPSSPKTNAPWLALFAGLCLLSRRFGKRPC